MTTYSTSQYATLSMIKSVMIKYTYIILAVALYHSLTNIYLSHSTCPNIHLSYYHTHPNSHMSHYILHLLTIDFIYINVRDLHVFFIAFGEIYDRNIFYFHL